MSSKINNKKRNIFLAIVAFVFTLVCNCSFVSAETAKLNHENFNISFKNISLDDEISIELENYDKNFTNDEYYRIIKVTFKNDKIIEAYEEDAGQYSKEGEDFPAKHTNDLIDKTSLSKDGKVTTLKINDLSPNEIALAVNTDFQVTVYRNGEKIIDRSDEGFDEDLFETDGYNRYYYSNFEIDLASGSIAESESDSVFLCVVLVIFTIIVLALFVFIVIKSKVLKRNKSK
ncbi:hypothetical protein IJI91_03125 [Candidatus Saccharibacteria bacterium]|nr:hypothetical protein [Candidatus Saccharibacteria bacterium]